MPTYLYECEKCGRFEEFQKITDDPIEECPECGSKVKRIIGAPGVIFKGSGFYSTDSRNDGANGHKAPADVNKPEGSSSGKTEGKNSTEKSTQKKDNMPSGEKAS